MFSNKYDLSFKALNKKEMIHHADDEIMISSHFNRVSVVSANVNVSFKLPLPFYLYLIGLFRLFRRVLRLCAEGLKCALLLTSEAFQFLFGHLLIR